MGNKASKKLRLILIVFLFLGCSTSRQLPRNNVIEEIDLNLYAIKDYTSYEVSIKSKDISRDYYVDISEEIYPYVKKYKLKPAKTFLRMSDSNFDVNVDYYYTKEGKVKLILYEWNANEKSSRFREKFDSIASYLNKKIGKYGYKSFESDTVSNDETYRDDLKWDSTEINAYLFRFGDRQNRFNQIRLAIYKNE